MSVYHGLTQEERVRLNRSDWKDYEITFMTPDGEIVMITARCGEETHRKLNDEVPALARRLGANGR